MPNEILKPKCFVIMGYGEKPDYPRNRVLNLDKTYDAIIKPAVKNAGYECIRSDEIKHSGLIDNPMYSNLLKADLVIADISTLNANALYELGIRHGIRAFSTIIMAQEEEQIPFDVNHVCVFRYKYLGNDIGYTEALKCQKELEELIKVVSENKEIDSPFYAHMGLDCLKNREEVINKQIFTYTPNTQEIIPLLADLCLIGKWDDTNQNDKQIIKDTFGLTDTDFQKLNSYSKENNSVLKMNNCYWNLERSEELTELCTKFYTPNIFNKFKDAAIKILSDIDTTFDLDKENRFMSSVYGKGTRYSKSLRLGIAESLVWLSINHEKLLANTQHQYLVYHIIQKVLSSNDWKLWASLNSLLPIFAEADPKAFMDSLQEQLTNSSNAIIGLFNQEGDGFTSGSLITGLLWGLETVAWFPNYFQRVCIFLAELTKIDKGGNFANRPIESLKELLLPWVNFSSTPIDTKIKTTKYLINDYQDISWKIIFSLLPQMHSVASGINKPKYRKELLKDKNTDVNSEDYYKQIDEYSKITIELMKQDSSRFYTVLENLNSINPELYDNLFIFLNDFDFSQMDEKEKIDLWENITKLIREHKKFKTAEWSYSYDVIEKLESFAKNIEPQELIQRSKQLFTLYEYDLVEDSCDDVDWDKVSKEIYERRKIVLDEILNNYEINILEEFICNEQMAFNISRILEEKKDIEIDKYLIPEFLNSNNKNMKTLCSSYIRIASYERDEYWFKHLQIETLSIEQQVSFIKNLKFELSTWELANETLKEEEHLYWENVNQNIHASKSDLSYAIEKFNSVGRINVSLECISRMFFDKKEPNVNLIVETLYKNLKLEQQHIDTFHFTDIFKYLEKSKDIDEDILCSLEISYFPLFSFEHKSIPKTLYKRLSYDADFYIQFIKMGYREENSTEQYDESETALRLAQNAWRILRNFKTVPGISDEGFINHQELNSWISSLLDLAKECNRVSIVQNYIGQILFHAPKDKDGFWIDKNVAKILDNFHNKKMLSGFKTECINSRGVVYVDISGTEDMSMGDLWAKKTEDLRENGFYNFADATEEIAEEYYNMAKQHKKIEIDLEGENKDYE